MSQSIHIGDPIFSNVYIDDEDKEILTDLTAILNPKRVDIHDPPSIDDDRFCEHENPLITGEPVKACLVNSKEIAMYRVEESSDNPNDGDEDDSFCADLTRYLSGGMTNDKKLNGDIKPVNNKSTKCDTRAGNLVERSCSKPAPKIGEKLKPNTLRRSKRNRNAFTNSKISDLDSTINSVKSVPQAKRTRRRPSISSSELSIAPDDDGLDDAKGIVGSEDNCEDVLLKDDISEVEFLFMGDSDNSDGIIMGQDSKYSLLKSRERKNPLSMSKIAVAARENRQKKKNMQEMLQENIKLLQKYNDELCDENEDLKKTIKELTSEVSYLKNVIHNQSTLSSLLKGIKNVQGVKLRTSSKPSDSEDEAIDMNSESNHVDHGYASSVAPPSAGVCLHVSGHEVSIEFCAKCSRAASE